MKIRNEEIYIKNEVEQDEYHIKLEYVFCRERTDTNEQEIFQFMANVLKNKIDTNIKRDLLQVSTTEEKVEEVSTIKEEISNIIPLSISEQRVYDYIQKSAPEGKKSEIVWKWPVDKEISEEIATFINCKTHEKPRVARYSYTTRINPSGKHNFWISHAQKIEGNFCEQDIEVDKLVELFDAVA